MNKDFFDFDDDDMSNLPPLFPEPDNIFPEIKPFGSGEEDWDNPDNYSDREWVDDEDYDDFDNT